MKPKTYLEKSVESFVKDEYSLKGIDVSLNVKNAKGSERNLKRLEHDSTKEMDFDLSDDLLD